MLRNGASPNLPRDYLDADRSPAARPGGRHLRRRRRDRAIVVTTPSFLADDKWGELRHLPLALGFVGAWSMPIKSPTDQRVLGTFGTYYRDERQPTTHEVEAVTGLCRRGGAGARPRRHA